MDDEHGKPSFLAQEQLPVEKRSSFQATVSSGKLRGCDLRGKPETGQFGLVANATLEKDTLVLSDCGILWSEANHDAMVEENGDPFVHLQASQIPAELLRPLVNSREWQLYRDGHTRRMKNGHIKKVARSHCVKSLVIECSSHGNESRHIDDPGWLYADHGAQLPEPTLEARLILDLERGLPTDGYFTAKKVRPGTELMMDWGKSALLSRLVMLFTSSFEASHKKCFVLKLSYRVLASISETILPQQAMVSIAVNKEYNALKQIAQYHELVLSELGDLDVPEEDSLF